MADVGPRDTGDDGVVSADARRERVGARAVALLGRLRDEPEGGRAVAWFDGCERARVDTLPVPAPADGRVGELLPCDDRKQRPNGAFVVVCRLGFRAPDMLRVGAGGQFRQRLSGDRRLPGNKTNDWTAGPQAIFASGPLFAALTGGATSQLGQTGSFGVLTVGALSGL